MALGDEHSLLQRDAGGLFYLDSRSLTGTFNLGHMYGSTSNQGVDEVLRRNPLAGRTPDYERAFRQGFAQGYNESLGRRANRAKRKGARRAKNRGLERPEDVQDESPRPPRNMRR